MTVQVLPSEWKFGLSLSSWNLDDKFNSLHDTFIQILKTSFWFKIKEIDKMRKEWLTNRIRVSCKLERELYICSKDSSNLL